MYCENVLNRRNVLQTPEECAAIMAKVKKFIADRNAKEGAVGSGSSGVNASSTPDAGATGTPGEETADTPGEEAIGTPGEHVNQEGVEN